MSNPTIEQITLPTGSTYDIVDAGARELIAALENATHWLGVTTTALYDGATTNPITINGESVTAVSGDEASYGSKEFIFNGTTWQEFGDLSALGTLAYKNSVSVSTTATGTVSQPTFTGTESSVTITATDNVSGNYEPKGSVSAPTISVATAGSTATIKNPTKQTVVTDMSVASPSATQATGELVYCSVSNKVLTLSKFVETTGDSITTSDVTVKTGDAAYSASAPSFTGTKVQLAGTTTADGTVSQPSFSGDAVSGVVTYSPS